MSTGVRLVVLGRQGAGKGTQSARLARHYSVAHVATGDILRRAVRAGSELGRRAKEHIDAGELLPDDLMVGIVAERLGGDDVRSGFVLDGFPRTVAQARALLEMTEPEGVDLVVNLDVPPEEVLARLDRRRVCRHCGATYSTAAPPEVEGVCDRCGGEVVQRDDDTPEAVNRRLALYERDTEPLIAWFEGRGLLVTVDGRGDADEVTERLVAVIAHRRREEEHAP
ncbi:MAG: adenylate kinase [Acidimicrobiales bacterium]